ncbi:hypothetical protein AIGOOFII_2201 [Methylobacterium marchantiae]|nr:hypothetical protein AIGOOFII_2201 [Methylobacterium marchantiae]
MALKKEGLVPAPVQDLLPTAVGHRSPSIGQGCQPIFSQSRHRARIHICHHDVQSRIFDGYTRDRDGRRHRGEKRTLSGIHRAEFERCFCGAKNGRMRGRSFPPSSVGSSIGVSRAEYGSGVFLLPDHGESIRVLLRPSHRSASVQRSRHQNFGLTEREAVHQRAEMSRLILIVVDPASSSRSQAERPGFPMVHPSLWTAICPWYPVKTVRCFRLTMVPVEPCSPLKQGAELLQRAVRGEDE